MYGNEDELELLHAITNIIYNNEYNCTVVQNKRKNEEIEPETVDETIQSDDTIMILGIGSLL